MIWLLFYIVDFRQEEIKMQFEGPDRVKISGERKTADKTIYFDKTYGVPDHADMERTNWKLEGGIFTVTIPKRLEAILSDNKSAEKDFQEISNSLPDNGDGSKKESDDEQVDENLKDQELQKKNEKSAENDSSSQRNQLNNAAKMICQSKNTIFMTLIAFCLGVLVSRKIGQ